MLNRLRIKNFKCLRDVDIPLGPFNVFIGPNASGKSSVFQALNLLARSISKPIDECFQEPSSFSKVKFACESEKDISIGITADELIYNLSISSGPIVKHEYFSYKGNVAYDRDENEGYFNTSENHKQKPRSNETLLYNTRSQHQNIESLKKLTNSIGRVHPYFLRPSTLAQDSYLPPNRLILENPQLDAYGYGLPSILSILASGAPEDKRYALIKQHFKEAIPSFSGFGVSLAPVTISNKDRSTWWDSGVKWDSGAMWDSDSNTNQYRQETGQSLYFELNPSNRKVSAAEVSDGTLLILGYLTLVYTTSNMRLLFIEEPENGIHPKLLSLVVDIFRSISQGTHGSNPVQIILTSHSPYLLDCVKPEEVFVFDKGNDGAASVTPMSKFENIDDWLSEYLLGELWYNWGEKKIVEKAKK